MVKTLGKSCETAGTVGPARESTSTTLKDIARYAICTVSIFLQAGSGINVRIGKEVPTFLRLELI